MDVDVEPAENDGELGYAYDKPAASRSSLVRRCTAQAGCVCVALGVWGCVESALFEIRRVVRGEMRMKLVS